MRKRPWFLEMAHWSQVRNLLCTLNLLIPFIKSTPLLKLINSINEIFDPAQTANVFKRDSVLRKASIASNKATNYGVVRQELLEHIYEKLYLQAIHTDSKNKHRILCYRTIIDAAFNSTGAILLKCHNGTSLYEKNSNELLEEVSEFDVVILATGYVRDAHLDMIEPLKHLLPKNLDTDNSFSWPVSVDYRVPFDEEKVDSSNAGLWMQGCNESTHGVSQFIHCSLSFYSWKNLTWVKKLSDTLLSILATRGGEMVHSIFGSCEKVANGISDASSTNGLEVSNGMVHWSYLEIFSIACSITILIMKWYEEKTRYKIGKLILT